jgi:hypothetical protein
MSGIKIGKFLVTDLHMARQRADIWVTPPVNDIRIFQEVELDAIEAAALERIHGTIVLKAILEKSVQHAFTTKDADCAKVDLSATETSFIERTPLSVKLIEKYMQAAALLREEYNKRKQT